MNEEKFHRTGFFIEAILAEEDGKPIWKRISTIELCFKREGEDSEGNPRYNISAFPATKREISQETAKTAVIREPKKSD